MPSPAGPIPNLHVLLIGVDHYRPGAVGGVSYPSLRGSVRDIALVEEFVRRRLEVPPNRLRKLTASAPADGQSFAAVARRAIARGRADEAAALAKQRPAGDSAAAAVLGQLAMARGQHAEAASILEPAATRDPGGEADGMA